MHINRNFRRVGLGLLLLTGCGSPTENQQDKISQVEHSLVSPVFIEGDSPSGVVGVTKIQ